MTHADCLSALRDSRLKADRMDAVRSIKFPESSLLPDSIYYRFTKNVMMYTDGPIHDSLRVSTRAAFTDGAHQHYREVIQHIADELVAAIPSGKSEIDAVQDLTAKLPVKAAVQAFGVPEEDLDFIVSRVEVIMTYWSGPQNQPIAFDQLLDHLAELHTYALELVEGKRGRVVPQTVIARLAAAQAGNKDCTLEQTIHQLVLLLIALFAPTTPGSLSSGVLSFATNPNQIERFLADRACIDNAANEVIRYNASNQFTWRLADTDLEIGGVRIGEGEMVALFIGAANRDRHVFEDPNRFNLDRPNSALHLSFGAGAHSCLGRQIASLEVGSFFTALFRRFSNVRLAGAPIWTPNLEFRSLRSLPVSLH
jgi:4-nitrotryptophan synthase